MATDIGHDEIGTTTPPPTGGRGYILALALICLVGLAIRLYSLMRPMSYDESFTYLNYVTRPLAVALSDFTFPNNHLFHTLLAHCTTWIFGNHAWSVRLPALLAGVAMIPVGYLLACRWYNRLTGVLTAVLLACIFYQVDYSTNARGYMLVSLCVLAALYFADLARQSLAKWPWVALAAMCILAMYTVLSSVYAVAGVVGWLALVIIVRDTSLPKRMLLTRLTITLGAIGAAVILLYLPIVMHQGLKMLTQNSRYERVSMHEVIVRMPRLLFDTWHEWHQVYAMVVVLLLLAGFVIAVFAHRALATHRITPLLPLALLPLPMMVLQHVIPFSRTFSYLQPVYLIMAAAGFAWLIEALAKRRPAFIPASAGLLALVFTLLFGVPTVLRMHAVQIAPFNTERISAFLATQMQEGDLFSANGMWAASIAYYLRERGIPAAQVMPKWEMEVWLLVPANAATPQRSLVFPVIRECDIPLVQRYIIPHLNPLVKFELVRLKDFGEYSVCALIPEKSKPH